MSLRPLRGHGVARHGLLRARRRDSVPPVLLIHGVPGVGKQRLALWLGQVLLCPRVDDDGPCGECKDCRLAVSLEHPDLHWFFPLPRPEGSRSPDKLAEALEEARADALAERRATGLWSPHSEEVRGLYLAVARTLRRKAQQKPVMSDRQLFVVGEAQELVPQASSPEAANALLKLLEEPPVGTLFALTSSRPGRLLPTVRSRSFPLHLSRLPADAVRGFLRDEVDADPDEAEKAARLSQGSIGRALDFLPDDGDPGALEDIREASFHLLRAGLSERPLRGLELAHDYSAWGARGLDDHFGHLEEWLRDLAAAAAGRDERVLNRDGRDYLARVAREKGVHPSDAARALEPVERARRLAAGNVNPQLIVVALVRELRSVLLGRPSRPGAATPKPPPDRGSRR